MTLAEEIRKMSAHRAAGLGLSPEVLLALTSTDKERIANAEAALAMLREGRELTPTIIKQLAADWAVAAMERRELRRDELLLSDLRQRIATIIATRAR